MFRNKMAYPVYLTIGNIPKYIRRKPLLQSHVLLAYLPTSRLEHITSSTTRSRAQANVYHSAMSFITAPLQQAGLNGIEITRGDGAVFLGHPILSNVVMDYPEQLLVTGIKKGLCPTCPIP
jgi:hypothetical protein